MEGDSKYTPRTYTESHPVGFTQFVLDDSSLQEDQDLWSRFQQRPLDLQLSTSNSSEDNVLDSEEVNLSLSIGMSTNKRSKIGGNNWKNKIVHPPSPDIKQKIVVHLDLNKDESSFHSYAESCNPIAKVSTCSIPKACCIDLDYLQPEPSSDLSVEKEIRTQKDIQDIDQKAAHSLVAISMQQTSTVNQDSETRSGSNEIENKNKMIPQSSIDSYESLVLKLEESSMDEGSATSKAFEVNELDQKENGIKLRRGRRLKDFQKDILPTLSSLSQHEIWEDINILEGVIRSREYKRQQKGKTGKREKWFTPVKSKRSKVNYVGQRCRDRKKKSTLSYAARKLELL